MPSQERVSWAKFRAAALAVASLAILSVLFYLLTGGTLLQQKTTLYLYISDATGLTKGSPVRVDGIDVGKVTAVDLTGSKDPKRVVRVMMEVQLDRLPSITADSYAQISADTLIGDKFVDINSGSSAGHIQPGAELTYKEQTEIFKTLDLTDFKKRLSAMDDLLSDLEAGRGAIGKAVQSDQFYNDLRNRIGGLQQAIHDVASTTGQVGQAVYTDKLYQRLSEPFVQMDQTLAQIQSGQGTAGQLVRDTGAYESARQSARDLQKAVADLRASDFMTSDALYNEWNRSLTQFIQTVDRMSADPMLSSTHVYETLTGTALELRNTVKDFRENPRKFLRLKVF